MDYRFSHLAPSKGKSYNESFSRLPYRNIVWDWEKDVLNGFIQCLSSNKSEIKYLDFACGTGRILGFLEDYTQEAFGVDVSESMLNVARENVHHSLLFHHDLTQELIFTDNYFDLITAFRFFLNAQQDLREAVLQIFQKILKKDGFFVFNIHMNRGCLLERGLTTYQRLKKIKNPKFHPISVSETEYLLQKFNFDVIQTFHYGIIPIYREDHKLLLNQLNALERVFSRLPSLLKISRYVIYVCRLKTIA